MSRWISLARIHQGYEPFLNPASAGLLTAEGICMHVGSLRKRYGFTALGTTKGSAITALPVGVFSGGFSLNRAGADFLEVYDSGTTLWTDAKPAEVTLANSRWAWTSIGAANGTGTDSALYVTPGYTFADDTLTGGIMKQTASTGSFTTVNESPGARALAGYAGRVFALGVYNASNQYYPTRVKATPVAAPDDWENYAAGAVEEDLFDDGYPILAARQIASRLFIFRGDLTGGSIAICTATDSTAFPLMFEFSYGITLLSSRTLVRISRDMYAFLGHDNFYLIDSTQIIPIGDAVVRKALAEMNPDNIINALGYYIPGENDVIFCIPTGTNTGYSYTYNLRTQKWSGPDNILRGGGAILCANTYRRTGAASVPTAGKRWNDAAFTNMPWSSNSNTWQSYEETGGLPGLGSGPALNVLGLSSGLVVYTDSNITSDNGTAISTTVETGVYDFAGEQFETGIAEAVDHKAVDGIYVRWWSNGSLALTFYISRDGGATWEDISFPTVAGSENYYSEKYITFAAKVGREFRVKMTHSSTTSRFAIAEIGLKVALANKARV